MQRVALRRRCANGEVTKERQSVLLAPHCKQSSNKRNSTPKILHAEEPSLTRNNTGKNRCAPVSFRVHASLVSQLCPNQLRCNISVILHRSSFFRSFVLISHVSHLELWNPLKNPSEPASPIFRARCAKFLHTVGLHLTYTIRWV